MRANSQTLTQAELVAELRELGFSDASETRIAAWRKLELLPQFSSGGSGQGRAAGRERCAWTNPIQVIEQAVWVMDLLKAYRRLDELYLPLWEMGFEVPLGRVRPALLQPLLTTTVDFEVEVEPDGRTSIEDDIDDQVFEIRPLIEGKLPVLDVPDTTLAALLNVVVNPDYKFWDQPYQDGVKDLREWEQLFAERCGTMLGDGLAINPETPQGKTELFTNASFINRYLSLPQLAWAMEACTDEELELVQRDLRLGRQMLQIFKRMVDLLTPFLPEAWRLSPSDMAVIFNFGRMMVWVDVALRRQGFGKSLDYLLPTMLQMLERDFDEAAARELEAAGPEIGKTLQRMEMMFTELPAR